MTMRLRYVGLGVTDLDAAIRFYRDDWRLEPAGDDHGQVLFGAPRSTDPFVLRVRPAAHDRVDVFAFELADRAAVDELHAHLVDTPGAHVTGPPDELDHAGGGYGFACFDPDGHLLELAADTSRNDTSRAGPDGSGHPPVEPGSGLPLELSHYVINATDPTALIEWYCAHLGFRVTDRLEDKLVFLTTTDAHHQVAIGTSTEVGLNHIAYDCGDVDDFMRATGWMIRRGHRLLWGPGRHGPGDNTFAYFRDPAGFIQEYTTGLESVAASDWQVRTWASVPEQSDLWGTSNPRPHAEFAGARDPGLGVLPGGVGEP